MQGAWAAQKASGQAARAGGKGRRLGRRQAYNVSKMSLRSSWVPRGSGSQPHCCTNSERHPRNGMASPGRAGSSDGALTGALLAAVAHVAHCCGCPLACVCGSAPVRGRSSILGCGLGSASTNSGTCGRFAVSERLRLPRTLQPPDDVGEMTSNAPLPRCEYCTRTSPRSEEDDPVSEAEKRAEVILSLLSVAPATRGVTLTLCIISKEAALALPPAKHGKSATW